MSAVERETRETRVRVQVTRGGGTARVATGEPFLDHMLVALARYAALDLDVQASGDLKHHVIEDVAITLGEALLPLTQAPIVRFAFAQVAMDDALVAATLDAGGRAYFAGRVPSTLYAHFFRSLCEHARITLHLECKRGTDRHHVIEAAFKAFGFTLRAALAPAAEVESTKGAVRVQAGGGC
jgi:imidazoleglycerol-phosphate dehydratase